MSSNPTNDVQLIAVWGSPNSGKTITSIRMATILAKQKKDVIIILTDILAPTLPVLLPFQTIHTASIGELLTAGELTQEKILQASVIPGHAKHISLIGYLKGENSCSHAEYTPDRAVDLLVLAKHLADVVIVDCSANLASDLLSMTALEMADRVLRLGSPTLQSVSFFQSQLPLLQDRRYHCDKHIRVLSNNIETDGTHAFVEALGGIEAEIPYVPELSQFMQNGRLFEEVRTRDGQRYEKGMTELIKAVMI